VLESGENKNAKQATIRSFRHQLYTTLFEKTALSAFDDKVFRLSKNEGHVFGYVKRG